MVRLTVPRALGVLCGLLLPFFAHAATTTANLSVTATVAANCTVTTSALAFGAYDPVNTNLSTALLGTGTISVRCTNGSAATLELDQGLNAAAGSTASAPLRRLKSGSNHLSYSLFSDAPRTVVWATGGPQSVSHTGTGNVTALTVYGSVAAGQQVPAGSYSDTVVVTVTF